MRFHEQVMGVYFDDLDPFRILHNARYLLLFERTIGAFWMHLGLGGLQEGREKHWHLVRSNHVEYLSPVKGVGNVRVRLWVERLGRTSLTFAFRLMPMDEDRDHATGSRTVVCVDPETLRSTPWSDEFRSALAPWVSEPQETS